MGTARAKGEDPRNPFPYEKGPASNHLSSGTPRARLHQPQLRNKMLVFFGVPPPPTLCPTLGARSSMGKARHKIIIRDRRSLLRFGARLNLGQGENVLDLMGSIVYVC